MKDLSEYRLLFAGLNLILLAVVLVNLSLGSVSIPIDKVFMILLRGAAEDENWKYIVLNYRLPKVFVAMFVGCGLSVSGLMMQTLFRNPMAGPYVLGISSGAGLGVALLLMGSAIFGGFVGFLAESSLGLVLAASLGGFMVMLAVLSMSVRVKDTLSLLIIGLMFSSLAAALVSVLAFFAPAASLQKYLFWSLGSLGNISWNNLFVFAGIMFVALFLSVLKIKTLNALLLGDRYAQSMGVNLKGNRLSILIATCLLAGTITAFVGPIAFIGLAVPHLTRLLFKTADHRMLLPAVGLVGAILMVICDSIAQLPGSELVLPINAVTSLIGAPVVIWLLVRKKRIYL
ncbi:MAG: iron ABC transporter permease [Bacteroidetes bacterium]|nr:iron ABC transporter permease [Bacteroidota bacterium]